jgi:2-hydroxycyclohexanecarboxyl-CoA dehydrogenase
MDLVLANHIAVVTGAASGIGRAVAAGFLAEGTRVAIWDIADTVETAADELSAGGGPTVIGLQVDVTDDDSIARALEQTIERLGAVDHLVHCAAIGSGHFGYPFTELQPDDWSRTLDVNIMGMVRVAHALAPGMVEREAGTMVFLASVAGQFGSQTDPPYSASKAANINFAQCVAKDLAGSGVRVNTICPGMIQTPLNRGVWQSWNDRQPEDLKQGYDEWAAGKIASVVPLGRWQRPEDVADMAVFLSSERAHNVTGQTINVDGGFVMHS